MCSGASLQTAASPNLVSSGLTPPRRSATTSGKPLRFVYLTDPHVYADKRVEKGMPRMLARLASLDTPPAFVVTGGDHIMDGFATSRKEAEQQWRLYLSMMRNGCDLPAFGVIGNHDIFGWGNPSVCESDRAYGKAMALNYLALDRSYYSFGSGGWKFIVLDNIARRDRKYFADLDPLQLEWLKGEIDGTEASTPICVFTHVPLLSACAMFDQGSARHDEYRIYDTSMQPRIAEVLSLFSNNPSGPRQLRLGISGHLHMIDRVDYRNTTFHCGGAVCGNWWQGAYQGHPPGFSVFDVWPDGTSSHQYITY